MTQIRNSGGRVGLISFDTLVHPITTLAKSAANPADLEVIIQLVENAKKVLIKTLQTKELPVAYCWLGKLFLQERNVEQGLNYLQKGLKLSPYDYDLLYTILYTYIKTDDKQDADKIYEKLNFIYPDFKDPLHIRDHFQNLKVKQ